MKIGFLAIAVSILAASFIIAGEEEPWFDMQNCEFCKSLTENPQLMNNMSWEHHKISNGLASITRVKAEFVGSYKEAQQKMRAVGDKMMRGEQVNVCNMCKSLGEIYNSGAKRDLVESDNIFVWVTTSDDPETVKMIHAWGERTTKEMMAMEQDEHSGHKH